MQPLNWDTAIDRGNFDTTPEPSLLGRRTLTEHLNSNSNMATPMKTHVQIAGDNAEFEDDNDQRDSIGGSNSERSDDDDDDDDEESDGRENDKDSDGGSDGEEAEDKDRGEDEEGGDNNVNAGWAEAMAKILGKKTPKSKTSILVKNKELDKMKDKEKQEQLEKKKQVDKKRAWEMMCREKPDIVKDHETERALQRIATRGVVQLFNAVRNHQKTIDDKVKEVGGSERKKAKFLSCVSKKDFINLLRKTEGGKVTSKTENDAAAAAEEKPAWSVLRDDFMMGATMKDWDKDSDREEPGTHLVRGLEEIDSD
ncbi:RRP15-like protein [Chaetodon trifascialis]|uniref:RRP15-like protein n=1 Tax=Chaetodon trifascialis TaxID=109706 RepID=UPI00399509A4